MPSIPESLIKTMSYEVREQNYRQELRERMQESKDMPPAKYDALIKYLTRKWRV